jgi:plastocyanin
VRRRLFAFAATLCVALAACSSGSAKFDVPGTPVRTDHVDMPKSLKYSPTVIEISAGTTVTWTNDDVFPHTVKLLDGSGTDKPVATGASTSITFAHAGTILYLCSIHPQMHGKIVVVP